MKKIKMWYARCFKVITNEQAIQWGLTHISNIHGDEVNRINCRSIWTDYKGRTYRVRSLKESEIQNNEGEMGDRDLWSDANEFLKTIFLKEEYDTKLYEYVEKKYTQNEFRLFNYFLKEVIGVRGTIFMIKKYV